MLQFMLGAPEWPGDQSLMFNRVKMIEMLLNVVHYSSVQKRNYDKGEN